MGEQENCEHPTRASKKRAYAAMASGVVQSKQIPKTKKRVVLGELTSSPNIVPIQNSVLDTHREPKVNKQNKEAVKLGIISCSNDNQKCYASSIYEHLRFLEMEEKRRPLPNYMEMVQNDVTPIMREILVDWLVDVAEEYKLVSDTLHLTVSYIDRFLSSHALRRNKLQLLGISCMLVASKYEEISPPNIEDFCYVTDNTYMKEEVVNMERDVLKFLNFEMGTPTTKTFLRIFTTAAQRNCKSSNLQFEFLACYLAELSLLDCKCVQFLPSTVAASSIFLSRLTIWPEVHPWSSALQQYSGYRPSELKKCVLVIHDLQSSTTGSSVHAARDKYAQHKFKCVSTLSPPLEISARYFEAIDE